MNDVISPLRPSSQVNAESAVQSVPALQYKTIKTVLERLCGLFFVAAFLLWQRGIKAKNNLNMAKALWSISIVFSLGCIVGIGIFTSTVLGDL